MAKNRFEQVDETQDDAITLTLRRVGDESMGSLTLPANPREEGGQQRSTGNVAAKDAFRNAVKLANQMKLAIVVCDPENIWDPEWGDLYRPVE